MVCVCVCVMTLQNIPQQTVCKPKGRVSSEFKFTMAAASGPCSGTRALAMLRDIFLGSTERRRSSVGQVCGQVGIEGNKTGQKAKTR